MVVVAVAQIVSSSNNSNIVSLFATTVRNKLFVYQYIFIVHGFLRVARNYLWATRICPIESIDKVNEYRVFWV